MSIYHSEREKYQLLLQQTTQKHLLLSGFRLALVLLALATGIQYFRAGGPLLLTVALVALAVFMALVRWHTRVAQRKQFYQQLVLINERELAALQGDYSAFDGGDTYVDPHHAYTFDLDVFGKNSLYQSLNRTANRIGADHLADHFLHNTTKSDIYTNQEAIRDLASRLQWRQEFLAMGQLHADQKGAYQQLLQWAAIPVEKTGQVLRLLWLLLTAGTIALGLAGLLLPSKELWQYFQIMAGLNLVLVMAHTKKIKSELQYLNAIFKTVEQYGFLLQHIEKEKFSSEKLQSLHQKIWASGQPASNAVLRLSKLLNQLESVQNLFAALIVNSLFLYHIHVLLALEKWKIRHATHIRDWIDAVGEMEALSSLAHFAFNNPAFVYPEISDAVECRMTDLGHPLIPQEQRINNSITFEQPGFVILTGSNMSGKSTFLRTVGINLLLAKMGAPVCASHCTTYPFDIFVCMKLSDSLHDNESYFFAELKRLKQIIDHLESGAPGFVLLDEVLRGTNSNDKLSGTLGLVETMLRVHATGILATHDLKVCALSDQHPGQLRNMCFEVEIGAESLHFDYRLRDGVCVNKSASFLMKKMGVIS